MTYPILGADGNVAFASLEEHQSLWPDFLAKGGVLVETTAPLAPLQEVRIVLSGGALTHPVSLTTQVAFTSGTRVMLQFGDVAPELLESLNPGSSAAPPAPVAMPPPEVPTAPPTLEAGDRLVFRDTPSFVAARRGLLTVGTVTALSAETAARAEAWLEVRVGGYSHPVLFGARVEPQPGGAGVLLHFVKGPQFARELERIDAAVGVRARRPSSGLIRASLEELRSARERPRSSFSAVAPVWEPVEAVPVAFVPRAPPPVAPPPRPAEIQPLPAMERAAADEPRFSEPDDDDSSLSSGPEGTGDPRSPARPAAVVTAVQQMARLKRSGDFANPRRPADLLALPATRVPTDAEIVRPSAFLLFRWLAGLATSHLGEFRVAGKVVAITILGKNQLRTDTPVEAMAKLLASPIGTYQVTERAQVPLLPHAVRTRAAMVEILRYEVRSFGDTELQAPFAARKSQRPSLKPGAEKIIALMDFTAPLERTATRMLHGQHPIEEILQSGIGPKAGWEILYLLEVFGALTWIG